MHDSSASWRRLPCPVVHAFNNLVKAILMLIHPSTLLSRFLLSAAALFSVPGFAQSGPLIVSHPQVIEAQKRGAGVRSC